MCNDVLPWCVMRYCLGVHNMCGGGVFFLACEDFGRMFDNSFPTCVFFCFVFKVEISSHILIPLFRPGSVHSCSAS